MAGARNPIALVGAAAVFIGLALIGSGFVLQATATQSEVNCGRTTPPGTDCSQASRSAQNTTVLAEYMTGVGLVVAGLGFFCVAWAVVSTLAARAERAPRGPSMGWTVGPPGPPPPPPAP